ncbi:embryonic protein UVS.2-like isoform X2 [Rhinoderma darwinii]|uniref:embryonic protein UVS.2-like isoform X2 n=1 Tax=Rhinoderma darwinii TaxID=43563 RepID=UPI003F66CA46
MALSIMLLWLVGCLLIQATPIKKTKDAGKTIAPYPYADSRAMFEIIKEANKDIAVFLVGGDINVKHSRSAKVCPGCQWKKSANGMVIVPFVVSPDYSSFEISMFDTLMKEFEIMTCVQFVNRSNEHDYISIETGGGCWSYVGKVGGDYSNFILDGGDTFQLPYGYNSILQFNSNYYSTGKPSMDVKSDPTITLGQYVGLDDSDVKKVNALYNCNVCSRKFVKLSGTFIYSSTLSSQGGPSCFYLIQSVYKVSLQLNDINILSSPDCDDAYIKVYDGVSKSSRLLLDKTCGSNVVPPLISSGFYMLIEIVNNQPSVESTFSASYQSVKYGETFVAQTGIVKSPGFPNIYPTHLDVVYSIIAPEGYTVVLNFLFFWIQNSPKCIPEYLIIRDGPLTTSPILGTYCGRLDNIQVASTGNVVLLQFHSGNLIEYNGFYAKYKFENNINSFRNIRLNSEYIRPSTDRDIL